MPTINIFLKKNLPKYFGKNKIPTSIKIVSETIISRSATTRMNATNIFSISAGYGYQFRSYIDKLAATLDHTQTIPETQLSNGLRDQRTRVDMVFISIL